MLSSGGQAADFVKVLRPTLDQNNMTHIKITCCDAEGWNHQNGMLGELKSRGVEDMLGVITGHSYTSQPSFAMNTKLPVWQTEAADLQGAWTAAWFQGGGAGEGWTWTNNIYNAITGGNAAAYLYWVGVQGGNTNSKLIRINNNVVYPSKRLWAMANWSRGIRPGAVRIGSSSGGGGGGGGGGFGFGGGGGGGLKTTAFQNVDGSISVQVINGGGETTATVSVSGGEFDAGSVKAWVTDNTHDCDPIEATLEAGSVTGNVPGRSMVTFLMVPPKEESEAQAEPETEPEPEHAPEPEPEPEPAE